MRAGGQSLQSDAARAGRIATGEAAAIAAEGHARTKSTVNPVRAKEERRSSVTGAVPCGPSAVAYRALPTESQQRARSAGGQKESWRRAKRKGRCRMWNEHQAIRARKGMLQKKLPASTRIEAAIAPIRD